MDIKPQVVRLSFATLVTAGFVMITLGGLGGFLSQLLMPRSLPPLPASDQQRFFPPIQEVTISPSTATARLLQNSQRSVVLVASAGTQTPLASGLVVTNDGLIVTAGELPPESELTASTPDGRILAVSRVATDATRGLTYLRLADGIFAPLPIANEDPAVGSQALAISRTRPAGSPWAQAVDLTHYTLPGEDSSLAIQRQLVTSSLTPSALPGSPLLNDGGQVVGLLTDPNQELALPASVLSDSLTEILQQKPPFNPFDQLGMQLRYVFIPVDANWRFGATVTRLKTLSPAATAGLKLNDVITAIAGAPLAWEKSVIDQLAQPLPLSLTIQRENQELTVTLPNNESAAP